MAKYRGWVVEVLYRDEFETEEQARQYGIDIRNKLQQLEPNREYYFEVDDLGSEDEE